MSTEAKYCDEENDIEFNSKEDYDNYRQGEEIFNRRGVTAAIPSIRVDSGYVTILKIFKLNDIDELVKLFYYLRQHEYNLCVLGDKFDLGLDDPYIKYEDEVYTLKDEFKFPGTIYYVEYESGNWDDDLLWEKDFILINTLLESARVDVLLQTKKLQQAKDAFKDIKKLKIEEQREKN